MTFLNEGQADRTVRMLGGLLLLSAGWTLPFNVLGIVLVAVGAIALATGHRRLVSCVHAVRHFNGEDACRPLLELRYRTSSGLMGLQQWRC